MNTRHASSFALVALATVFTACATRPESISASFVSHEKYAEMSCQHLALRMMETRTALAEASADQDRRANIDAAGVFLLLVPVSKLTGDRAAEVARLKGEVEAVDTALIRGRCKSA